jgi:DNA-binding GntR family transcriptional regulator
MPVPEHRRAVHRHLLRDDAYNALRDAVVSGLLAPGEQLHDDELCAWLGLSRTPVRLALARLTDEGLVETAPQRFTRVAALCAADAHDLFPVLAALHSLAAELAVPRLTRDDLAALRAHNDRYIAALRDGDAAAAWEADDRFHGVFVAASGNADLARLLERVGAKLARIEALHTGVLPGRRSLAQHEAVVARASVVDAARAATAVRENWLELGALLERALLQMRYATGPVPPLDGPAGA